MEKDPIYLSMPPDILGKDALWKLLKEYEFKTVLDIGAGAGAHSKILAESGKNVTAITLPDHILNEKTKDKVGIVWKSFIFDEETKGNVDLIAGDYMLTKFKKKFDCIWASHILEHMLNPGLFLDKVYDDLTDTGILAISVPPNEKLVGGNHINNFSPEHLVYYLVMTGFDLTDMRLKTYGYNLSVICRKTPTILVNRSTSAGELVNRKNQLPDYVNAAIEKYTAEHNGHERIPNNIVYKW